jgi:hypothetical protein
MRFPVVIYPWSRRNDCAVRDENASEVCPKTCHCLPLTAIDCISRRSNAVDEAPAEFGPYDSTAIPAGQPQPILFAAIGAAWSKPAGYLSGLRIASLDSVLKELTCRRQL